MSIAYTGINGNNKVLGANNISVTLSAQSTVGDYVVLAVFVANNTAILPVVSSISDTNNINWINQSGFQLITSSGTSYYVGLWYGLVPSPVVVGGDVITVNFSAVEGNLGVVAGEFSGIGGIDLGCSVTNSGRTPSVSANVNIASINELVVAAVLATTSGGDPGMNWQEVGQLGPSWSNSGLLYNLIGNTSGPQVATPLTQVGHTGWAVALGGFIPSSGRTPRAAPAHIVLSILELNGGGSPISLDSTATGEATFTGGSDTATPSFSATLQNQFEAVIAAVTAQGGSVTMAQQPGYIPLLVPTPNTGVFVSYPGSQQGADTIQPAILSSSVDSAICVLTLAANQKLAESLVISPVFPDTFSPRLAEDAYDSLSNDPTYTPNPYGPQPWTN